MRRSYSPAPMPCVSPRSTQRRHLWVGWFFAALAIALPAAVLAYGLITPFAAQLQKAGLPAELIQAAQAGRGLQIQLMLLALLPVVGLSYALWQAGRCSREFARGQAFAHDAVRALKQCARGMVFTAIVGLVLPTIISLLVSWQTSAQPRSLVVSLDAHTLVFLAFAALIAQMAAVLRQGTALAEENAQFV